MKEQLRMGILSKEVDYFWYISKILLNYIIQGNDSPTTSPRERKGSVLRAASAMAGGIERTEDITYIPLKAWSKLPSTKELIVKKEQRRQRFGDGIDFPDFNLPFKENFMKRSSDLGGVDSDDED